MTSDPRNALEQELDGRVPDGLSTLKDDELSDLAELLQAAKQRQSQALDQGIDEALEIVPRVARGSVRKMLFK
ncbi:hypothetical protein BH20ACT17_BH20ACT17_03330 [soil metagenome]